MGISLEDVLATLKELENDASYFMSCIGKDDKELIEKLRDLEEYLRSANER